MGKKTPFGEIDDVVVDRVALGRRARTKGTNYERTIARLMSKYTGLRWNRVPYSGASYIPGDVTCLDKPYPLVIELKNRADCNLNRVFRNPQTINTYVNEEQVLIFNNSGQNIVVAPYNKITSVSIRFPDNHAMVKIAGIMYIVLDLKDFCSIIMEYWGG